jgi:propionate CoA-transferase
MNIAQSARRLVFCCTFRAGDLEVAVEDGALRILREGKHAKFVRSLDQVSFHGPSALARGQQVLYVTERAVFELTERGLRLVEIAPGVDLATEVLGRMEFIPEIAGSLRELML